MKYYYLPLILSSFFSCHYQNNNEKEFVFDRDKSKNKVDSLINVDFTVVDYEYFDSEFNIKPISSKEFQKKVKAMNLGKRNKMDYTDSIHVLFFDHFQDWDAARIATNQIVSTWETISFCIWTSEEEAKAKGESLGFKFPSLFLKYLETDPDIQWFQERKNELKTGLKKIKPDLKVDELSTKEILRQSFYSSEVRLRKYPHKH